MSQDSILLVKSMDFAVRVVNLYKHLQSEKKEAKKTSWGMDDMIINHSLRRDS